MSYAGDEDGAGRPKLSLQPRGSAADGVSATSAKSSRPNPFGAARPREQVIAEREGKKETEVLKEQIQKDWKPAIVFTEAQREEKKAAEAELAFAKSELDKEVDPLKLKGLRDEVALKEKRLDELLLSFEKLAVQSAQSGGTRRSHERTRREDDRVSSSPVPQYGREVADSTEGYGNFRGRGRERDRDPEGTGSYGDTWGGSTRKSGSSQPCYTCGEVGHFSRECPSGGGGSRGAYGGNFGGGGRSSGGRQCYTCGQEGHFSRECPQGGGGSYGGARGGSYGSGGGAGGYGGGYDAYGGGGGGGGGGGSYVQDYQAPSSYGGQAAGGYGTGYDDRSAGGGYGAAANRGGSYSTGRPEYDSRGSW